LGAASLLDPQNQVFFDGSVALLLVNLRPFSDGCDSLFTVSFLEAFGSFFTGSYLTGSTFFSVISTFFSTVSY